jgi:hypothetical protein
LGIGFDGRLDGVVVLFTPPGPVPVCGVCGPVLDEGGPDGEDGAFVVFAVSGPPPDFGPCGPALGAG